MAPRDERGQVLPTVAAIIAAIALAGATLGAMVWASDAKRSRAIEEKVAREEFTAPAIIIAGLAASGPERQCALAVLSRHGVTGEDPTWRAAAVPLPASTGNRTQDRRLLDEWKLRMRAYIRSFQSEIDQCRPTTNSVPNPEHLIDGDYDVKAQILEAKTAGSFVCDSNSGLVTVSTSTDGERVTLAFDGGRVATGPLSNDYNFSFSAPTTDSRFASRIQGHLSVADNPIRIEFTELVSATLEDGEYRCKIRSTGVRLEE